MKTDWTSISPHLYGVASRTLDEPIDKIGEALETAMKNAGAKEFDFEREEGVNYNPRPARVALILIKDAKVRSIKAIAAGILASVELPFEVESKEEKDIIAVANWLDRARHLHLAEKGKIQEDSVLDFQLEFLKETEEYLKLAKNCSKELFILLDAWKSRFERRINS